MKMGRFLLFIAPIILMCNAASAAETYKWNARAVDSVTNVPLAGVALEVIVTDRRDNNKELVGKCVTDTSGGCELRVEVSSSLWSGTSIFYKFSVRKNGYSEAATRREERVSNYVYNILMTLSPLSIPSNISGTSRNWPIDNGPNIFEHTKLEPIGIQELFKKGAINAAGRGKFESDEEFEARSKIASKRLLVAPVNPLLCPTKYDHSARVYSVTGCVIFARDSPAGVFQEEGEDLVLSNAYDRRRVKRLQQASYSISNTSGISWTAEFKMSARDAEALDADLMMGLELEGMQITSQCPLCQQRERNDLVNETVDVLNRITNTRGSNANSWRDEAFKSGSVLEDWSYVGKAGKITRYFIFRKSDRRILFEHSVQ